MKKQVLSLIITAGLVVNMPFSTFAAEPSIPAPTLPQKSGENINSVIKVTLDGQKQELTIDPVITSGVTFISARDFCNIFGLSMTWTQKQKEIIIADGKTNVILKISSTTALINNKAHTLPKAPFILNGSTMIPVKYLGNAFGFNVSWNQSENQIVLISPVKKAISTEPAIALLSYDAAIQTGIKKSPDYQSSLLSKDRVVSQDDDLFIAPGTYNLKLLQTKQDLKMYNSWADKQIALTMEQVGNSVKNQMDDLSLMFVEKQNQQDQVDLMAEKLRIEKIKYENGTSSMQSLLSIQTSHSAQVQNLIILDQKINAAYVKLNQTLANPADYRNSLEYDVAYEPIGEVNLDHKIIDDTAADPYIWYANQTVDSKEFKLNTYEYNAGGQSWSLTAMDLTEARKNVNDTKTALAGVIRDRYQNLLQLESQIRLLELNLEQAKDSVNAIRLQYDLGNAIKLQVEEAQMAIPDLEYQIQNLKQQHEQLKMIFNKPYLAPTYVKSSSGAS